MQVLLFAFLSQTHTAPWLRRLLLLLLIAESIHGMYFTIKEPVGTKLDPLTKSHSVSKDMTAMAHQKQTKDDFDGLITSDIGLSRYARLSGVKTFALTDAPVDSLFVPRNSRFLVVTHVQDSALRKQFSAPGLHITKIVPPFVVATFQTP
jgi:hypothetical protein